MKTETKRAVGRCAVAAGAVLCAFALVKCLHIMKVSGSSMYPTIKDGAFIQYVPYKKSDVKRGDIVVYKDGRSVLVKRVVGTPHDFLVVKDGILYVNGEKDASSVIHGAIVEPGVLSQKVTLSSNQYFCIGDNYSHSVDCRATGAIEDWQIIGVVSEVY